MAIFMDVTFGTNDMIYHLLILMHVQFPSHMDAHHLGHQELTNMWRYSGIVGCLTDKAPFTYATL